MILIFNIIWNKFIAVSRKYYDIIGGKQGFGRYKTENDYVYVMIQFSSIIIGVVFIYAINIGSDLTPLSPDYAHV